MVAFAGQGEVEGYCFREPQLLVVFPKYSSFLLLKNGLRFRNVLVIKADIVADAKYLSLNLSFPVSKVAHFGKG